MMFFTVSADHEAHHFCRKRPSVFPSVYGSIADAQLFGQTASGTASVRYAVSELHLQRSFASPLLYSTVQHSMPLQKQARNCTFHSINGKRILSFYSVSAEQREMRAKKSSVTAAVTIFLITKIALDCLNLAAVKGYPSFLISNIIFIPRFLQIHGTTYMSVELAPSLYVNTAVR